MLLAAGRALVDVAPRQHVGIVMPASAAAETFRPARLEQMLPALLVRAEPGDERRQIPWQIVRQHVSPLTGFSTHPTEQLLQFNRILTVVES